MKRRMLCLALCLVLLLPAVLAGCKKESSIEDKFQQTATTLTMWVVTEDENSVSEEAKKIVSAKLDEITKDRFKVHLVVNYIPESVYRETIDNEIRGFYETRSHITPKGEEEENKPAETEVNEWGITVIKYPALLDHQVDIVYLQGEEMFKTYAKNGWLSSLNVELNGNSKAIRSNINGHLLSAASYEGEIYAIPNNHALGEYTVMLLNKELMAQTDTDGVLSQIDGLFNKYVYNYLEEVKSKGDENILPINASYSECLDLLAYFWNINPDTLENEGGLSVIGYRYEDLSEISRSVPLEFNSLFTDPEFTKAFLKLKEYQFEGGYFGETEGEKIAALSIATMGYEELTAYRAADSEYYPVVLKNPTLTEEDVYGSMFGVCSQTDSLEHCMKVLTLLNTNAEFRNILQYGVENKTYQLVPDPNDNQKRIVSYSEEYPYHMNIFKTGNAFLTYPEPGMDENVWEIGKAQNRDVTGADPTMDLNFRSIAISGMEENTIENTATYQVRLNQEIALSTISSNPVLWQWYSENCAAAEAGSLQVLQSQKEIANGKTKYTYLVYAPGLEYFTDVSIGYQGSAAAPELELNFDDTGATIDSEFDRTYALWLVTVEAEASVESVKFNLFRNGEAAEANIVVPETDPDFTYCGTLNSELIRYLYELNGKLVVKIEECTTMEELKALLVEIKRLLTPQTENEWYLRINQRDNQENPIGYEAEVAQYTLLSDVIATLDLEEVNYAVVSATSEKYVARKDAVLNPSNDKYEVSDVYTDSKSGEDYDQLDSPYALYTAWLKFNGYTK
ncbi:MAG: hypothetical protein E7680_02940 [Ruminococcaceae bacterium]|nr:hypothetical protein [Oscillospiraceae bacterium]